MAAELSRPALLCPDDRGLWCAAGGFHVDPWNPVPRAVITHAHGDHARWGSAAYLAAEPSLPLLRRRLGEAAVLEGVPYGKRVRLGETTVSFHPAGHVLGSAQVRVEREGEVWVVSGDYKRQPDSTCAQFEPVACDTFVTEATFGLPIYRWPDTPEVAREVLAWWQESAAAGRAAVLFCYALGKAQRLLAELALLTDRPVFVHGAVEPLNACYRDAGIPMLPTRLVGTSGDVERGRSFAGEMVLAPPSAAGSPWMRRFGDASTGFASGWMRVRAARRGRGYERGFVLSDHADWPDLLRSIAETGARRILATHGATGPLVRYLCEQGYDAAALATAYQGEAEDEVPASDPKESG
ncbi:MAG TPA: ligase-associated DNA damage response exonuclease [Thermoanaerobaculia bacterium]|nr:ligase-associated DNA damage response exonuclease [Thermoanaerobaculia bacterium]